MQEQNDARFDQLLEQGGRIENQTTKTNGHVADAFKKIDTNRREQEIENEKLRKFNWILIGGWGIFTILVAPILVGLVLSELSRKPITPLEVQQASEAGVNQALQAYNISK